MNPYARLFESMTRAVDEGKRVAFCLLVHTKGSTPQSAGAAMLVHETMATEGTLGGGCVEAEVRRRAFELLRAGESRLLEFVLDHDFGWDDGLVCGGRMDIAVASLVTREQTDPYRDALAAISSHRPAVVPVRALRGEEWVEYRIHADVPPTLVIAGGGHVGLALARLAVDLDFRVVIIDDRTEYSNSERFPPPIETLAGDIEQILRGYPFDEHSYIVIVTRGHKHDRAALAAVIESPARYVGLIGSKRKIRLIFEELEESGVSRDKIERVHAPIGIPIGAVTVPEIAVSIAGQLIQERRREPERLIEGPFALAAEHQSTRG